VNIAGLGAFYHLLQINYSIRNFFESVKFKKLSDSILNCFSPFMIFDKQFWKSLLNITYFWGCNSANLICYGYF